MQEAALSRLLPEFSHDGLLLWRLGRSINQYLWCAVGKAGDEYLLVVRDPETRWTSVAETHSEARSLIRRALRLRDQLLAAGWRPVYIGETDTVH